MATIESNKAIDALMDRARYAQYVQRSRNNRCYSYDVWRAAMYAHINSVTNVFTNSVFLGKVSESYYETNFSNSYYLGLVTIKPGEKFTYHDLNYMLFVTRNRNKHFAIDRDTRILKYAKVCADRKCLELPKNFRVKLTQKYIKRR